MFSGTISSVTTSVFHRLLSCGHWYLSFGDSSLIGFASICARYNSVVDSSTGMLLVVVADSFESELVRVNVCFGVGTVLGLLLASYLCLSCCTARPAPQCSILLYLQALLRGCLQYCAAVTES